MKRLFVLLLIFFAFSCSDRTGIPNDIIPMESMEKIMADIVLANNYSSDYLQKDSTRKDKVKANQDLMAIIFKIHHTTAVDFKKSLVFYESRPDLSKKIFDSLEVYNNIHRKDDYKPLGKGPLRPGTKPPIGPNGKPITNPPAIVPLNKGAIPPHTMPPHPIPQNKIPPNKIPPHTAPSKKPVGNTPLKHVPAATQ
jgi:Domain of unknown function (DUF4296)